MHHTHAHTQNIELNISYDNTNEDHNKVSVEGNIDHMLLTNEIFFTVSRVLAIPHQTIPNTGTGTL